MTDLIDIVEQIEEWVSTGHLDRTMADAIAASLRRATDDVYDADARLGNWLTQMETRHQEDRADIATLLQLLHSASWARVAVGGMADEWERVSEIATRIGWTAE